MKKRKAGIKIKITWDGTIDLWTAIAVQRGKRIASANGREQIEALWNMHAQLAFNDQIVPHLKRNENGWE